MAAGLVDSGALEDAVASYERSLGVGNGSAKDVLRLLLQHPTSLLTLVETASVLHTPDLSLVPDVDELVQTKLNEMYATRVDDVALIKKKKRMSAQNKRVLAALLSRVGEDVTLTELLIINNLATDTPKRVRELREEHGGWQVEVSGTGRGSRYRLLDATPDLTASANWWLKNNIRTARALNAQSRILALLRARLGESVPLADIRYVNPERAGSGRGRARQAQAETTRRLRALREDGWQVYSGLDNVVADLAPSEYTMVTVQRFPPYERLRASIWARVIARDNRTCQNCGWTTCAGSSQGRKCLEVHHRNPQRARPEDVNNPANLVTLCNVCHDAAS